jgi:hypothetical protein
LVAGERSADVTIHARPTQRAPGKLPLQSNTVSTYRYATALGSEAVGSPAAYSVSAAEPRT